MRGQAMLLSKDALTICFAHVACWLQARGIRLARAQGVNVHAVSEHAFALILALSRRLPEAPNNQARNHWRGMIGDLEQREDRLGGKKRPDASPLWRGELALLHQAL